MTESVSFKLNDKQPKSARPATPRQTKIANNETVDRAVSVMNNLYAAAGVGLVFLQLPKSAEVLAEEKATLEKANREAFTASPKLAEFIANAGSASSVATFVIAHVMTVAQIVNVARKEKVSRETKPKPKPGLKIVTPENDTPASEEKVTKNERSNVDVGTILGTFS